MGLSGKARPSSFRTRLTLAFGALFGVTTILTVITQLYGVPFLYRGIEEEVKSNTFRILTLSANLCKERVNWWLFERSGDIVLLSNNSVLRENFLLLSNAIPPDTQPSQTETNIELKRSRQDITDSLAMVQTAYKVYDSIEIADAKSGIVLVSSKPEAVGASRVGKDYFTNAVRFGAFDGLEANKAGGNHFFVISRLITSPVDGGPLGVIIMRVRSSHALEPSRAIGPLIGEGGEIVMIDANANVLASMDYHDGNYIPRDTFRRAAHNAPGHIAAVRKIDGEMEALDYRGEPTLAAFRYVELNRDYGFGLVVKMDAAAVKAEIRRIFIPLLLTDIIFFSILATAIYAISGKFTAPLEKLSSTAGDFGAGNLAARAEPDGPRETRLLADSFNKMAERIESRERTLMESEKYFRTLFNTISDMALVHELPAGKFIEVNDATVRTLGYSREEFLNLSITDIEDAAFTEGATPPEEILRVIREGRTVVFRRRAKKANGTTIPVEVHSCLFEYRGRETVLSIARDITERIRAEEELKAEKRLAEEATDLKEKYVSLVSHDLKNPLHGILGALRMVMRDAAGHPNPRVGAMLESAFDSGLKMLRLINEILDINRFKRGRVRFNLRFVDAHSIAEKAMAGFRQDAERKDVHMINSMPERARIYTDEALLTEVMGNLVSNAVKFCRRGDSVTIFMPEGKQSVLAVKDTGVGISEEAVGDIFNYERRVSTPGTEGETGTGFGLPLSRDIMRAMGGRLTVESSPGWGSVFYVELPFVKPRLLLVDDEPDTRIALRGYLEPLKIDIAEAVNGKEALDIARQWKPHIMILDLAMPVMDGFATLERLRLDDSAASMPVLVMTGETDMETRERIFRLGAQDCIQKPTTADDLLPRVRRFIV